MSQKRVAEKSKNETIAEFRLFNNLLSSHPMTFNLFYPPHVIVEAGSRSGYVCREVGLQERPL